jgi:ribosomal protein S18 acetylase RimI-like enzyme
LAEFAAHPAGYLMAETVTLEETPFTKRQHLLHLQHLVVAADLQGHGIGKALAKHAVRESRRLGCDAIHLICWSFNVAAQEFFAAQGFKMNQVRMVHPAIIDDPSTS